MTNQQDLSTPAQVRHFIMSSIQISIDAAKEAFPHNLRAYKRRGFEFFEFTDGNNDESGLIAVDPITAQRFEIRIREEE